MKKKNNYGGLYIYPHFFYRVFIINENGMNINVNHPTFVTFLEQTTQTILSNISVDNYFSLPQEKRRNVQILVFKLLKKVISVRAKFSENEIKGFLVVLRTKNEENEKYEFAGILKDINNNYDIINELIEQKKPRNKKIKIENRE